MSVEYERLLSPNEVLLYGQKFKLAGAGTVQESLVSVFPGKIVQGDATRADDPIASSYVMSDWTGGLLKEIMDPAVDFDRFYFSSGATWFSRQLTLGPYVRFINPPTWPAGTNTQHIRAGAEYAGVQYLGWGRFLVKVELNETVTIVADLGLPITYMQVYRIMAGANAGQSRLVLVCNDGSTASKYAVYDGTTVVDGPPTEYATWLLIWDDKLIKLDYKGFLRSTLDLVTWTDLLGAVVTLPYGSAETLAIYPNGLGDDAVHIGTTEGLYFYDESLAKLRRTKVVLPRIRNQGRTMTNHQDNLYYGGASRQILRYTGPTIDPNSGLDQGDGLPAAFRGTVTCLQSSLNFLLATVESQENAPLGDTIYLGDELSYGTTVYATQGFAFLAGQSHIGGGWHMLYPTETVGTGMKWVDTSTADDKYRLWFGVDGRLGVMDMHPDILNTLQNPLQDYRRTWDHITPWNDHGWSELDKLALMQEFGCERLEGQCVCKITMYYALDGTEAWTFLAELTVNKPERVLYGEAGLGVSYRRIRYRIIGERCDNVRHTPVLRFSTEVFLKQLPSRWGYRLDIDCTERYAGLTPEEQVNFLKNLSDPDKTGDLLGEMVAWVDGIWTHKRVKLVTLSSQLGSGPNTYGQVKVSVVEPVL